MYGKSEKEIDSLVKTVKMCCKDIGMEFGVSKCATLVMKRGKRAHSDGIVLSDEECILETDDGGYKYLGILELDDIMHKEMKEKVKTTYLKRLKLVLKSKLNSRNLINAINTWAVAVVRYSAGIVNWTKDEIDLLDRKTRKTLTMHGALHPKANVSRLYMKRKIGGRGLISISDCVYGEQRSIKYYIAKSEEELIEHAAVELGVTEADLEEKNQYQHRVACERKEALEVMQLHGQFHRDTKDVKNGESLWEWLRSGDLKRETESLLVAAQDQALNTNAVKKEIYHTTATNKCRLCNERVENVDHVVAGCKMLAQKEYKRRHDKVCLNLHWSLCRKFGYSASDEWYNHVPEKVLNETGKPKILWDFNIQTDRTIEHRRPDIIVHDVEKGERLIIDVAIPADKNIADKEVEK